jgi:predicted SPOUT superfamily RNA methylase MTH1
VFYFVFVNIKYGIEFEEQFVNTYILEQQLIMEIFFIIILSILVTLGIVTVMRNFKLKKQTNSQSVILLDKIKRVCKFITVEGDFAEIYHYEDVKERFLKLITSKKKALVVINAKAHVGFDLSRIKMDSNVKTKTVKLFHFPEPEVLSIETDLNYYDKKDGVFNKFEASDLTELHNEAKLHIMNKVPESGLYQIAKKEALDSILLIESIVETIGWTLDYTALEIEDTEPKKLE